MTTKSSSTSPRSTSRRASRSGAQIGILAAAGLYALDHNLGRLPEDHVNARTIAEALAGVKGLTLPPEDRAGVTETVYHMFVIRLENNDKREALARHLKANGVETGVHYPVPNHLQPAIEEVFGKQPSLPRTEDYVRRILSLPMFPALTEADVKTVAAAVRDGLR